MYELSAVIAGTGVSGSLLSEADRYNSVSRAVPPRTHMRMCRPLERSRKRVKALGVCA